MYSYDDKEFFEGVTEHDGDGWIQFLDTIKAEALLRSQVNLHDLWTHLRREEPELLDTFEYFVDNAVREIDRIRADRNVALKSKEHSDREVQQIFIDVEKILEEERIRIRNECEEKYQIELRRQIELKQRELDDVIDRKRCLEGQLLDISKNEKRTSESIRNLHRTVEELSTREHELKTENDDLQQENQRLHLQLSTSLDNLHKSQELCLKLHERAENEKREIVREFQDAVAENEEKTKETALLEMQLEKLKERLTEEEHRNVQPLLITGKSTSTTDNLQTYHSRLSTINSEGEYDQVSYDVAVARTPDHVFKIIMLGDSNVGKTSLIQRFCKNEFSSIRRPTLDITYQVKTITTAQGVTSLQIWDTAGQERFRSIPKTYFRKADGIMLMYDVTNEKSMKNVRHWISSIGESSENGVALMLLGNKIDLKAKLDENAGRKVAKECKAWFALVSAKTGENVPQAFEAMTRLLHQREKGSTHEPLTIGDYIELKAEEKKRSCCG